MVKKTFIYNKQVQNIVVIFYYIKINFYKIKNIDYNFDQFVFLL